MRRECQSLAFQIQRWEYLPLAAAAGESFHLTSFWTINIETREICKEKLKFNEIHVQDDDNSVAIISHRLLFYIRIDNKEVAYFYWSVQGFYKKKEEEEELFFWTAIQKSWLHDFRTNQKAGIYLICFS